MAIKSICEHIDCTGCGTCREVCPVSAITLKEDGEGFAYPVVADSCVECGRCTKICPVNHDVPRGEVQFYMGWHRDEEVLLRSSSGGVFTALAAAVLDRGGVVYGVAETDGRLRHIAIDRIGDLDAIRLSKYYQADTDDSYREIRDLLQDGREVLFSGTACQVAGLKSFLGAKEYPGLYTVDVLCHGVASKKVVDAFLASKERQFKQKVVGYDFRVKEEGRGWYNGGGTRMRLTLEDGSVVVEPGKYDTYFLGFNNNLFLRESCYRCKFCGTKRVSDITLADYWRCEEPEIGQRQLQLGVSLVLANTEQGHKLLDAASSDLEFYPIDGSNAIAHNRALDRPQERPAMRDSFFARMERLGYDRVIMRQFWPRFARRRIKRVLRRILPTQAYARFFND